MGCLTENSLGRYLDGKSTPEEAEAVYRAPDEMAAPAWRGRGRGGPLSCGK